MDKFAKSTTRDTILFVNDPTPLDLQTLPQAIARLSEEIGRSLNVLVLTDKKYVDKSLKKLPFNFERIVCDTRSVRHIEKALIPYEDRLLMVTGWHDWNIPIFQRVIPNVPYLHAPTVDSLEWATDKIQMRRRLVNFNPKTSPKFEIVEEISDKSLSRIKRNLGYPVIVKPAGLAASVLVSVCYHEEELKKVLNKSFRKLKKVYKETKGRGKPAIIVEQFMEGRMYSTDIYVNHRGEMWATPLVNVVTGFSVGKNDFFGYKRMLPVTLKQTSQEKGLTVAREGVKALALRSVTTHVELMLTDEGWKIIEIGPRMGGYRHEMYNRAFGINHALNDLKVRVPMEPKVPKKALGHSCVMQFYPETEGTLKKITGLNKARALNSVTLIEASKKAGDKVLFASSGGSAVVVARLFNKDKSDLLADIRRLEQALKIDVEKKSHDISAKIVTEVTDEIINDQLEPIQEE